jgi:hypothetical protein
MMVRSVYTGIVTGQWSLRAMGGEGRKEEFEQCQGQKKSKYGKVRNSPFKEGPHGSINAISQKVAGSNPDEVTEFFQFT